MAAEDNLQFDLFISLFIHLLFISSCGSVNASEQKSLLLFTKIRKTKPSTYLYAFEYIT